MNRVFYIDGGCSGNSQRDQRKRKMISVVCNEFGKVLIEKENKGGSNNIAEFIALKEALRFCIEKGIKQAIIITDSKNNLSWFNNKLKKKKQNNFEWVKELREEIDIYKMSVKVELHWASRDSNLAGHYIEEKYKL